MLTNTFVKPVLALAIFSACVAANAYTVITTEVVKGKIVEVDSSARQLTVASRSGKAKTLQLEAGASVFFKGQGEGELSDLLPGHEIKYSKTTSKTSNETIKGVLLGYSEDKNLVRLKVAGSNSTVTIKLSDNASIRSEVEDAAFEELKDLRAGLLVTIQERAAINQVAQN